MNEDLFQLGVKALIFNNKDEILLLKVNIESLCNIKEPYFDIPGGACCAGRHYRGNAQAGNTRGDWYQKNGSNYSVYDRHIQYPHSCL